MEPSSRLKTLQANANALSTSLPALARALREIPETKLESLPTITLPEVPGDQVKAFALKVKEEVKGDGIVLLGLSSPALLSALQEILAPDQVLIVIEPALEIAIRLLSQYDFTPALKNRYTTMSFAAEDKELQSQVSELVTGWGLSELQLVPNPMRPLHEKIPQMVAELLSGAMNGIELRMATAAQYGKQAIRSICTNLIPALAAYDISALANSFKGVPAFCIGAGPSLDQALPYLHEAKEKGLIIAADAALPPLIEAGITPEIVTTLDVIATKAEIFERYYAKDALLVALLSSHSDIVQSWIGPRAFAVDQHPLSTWAATTSIVPPSRFGSLGNVALLSFSLARGLGCDPIVLIGTDMAFERSGRTYAQGVIHHPQDYQEGKTIPQEHMVEIVANDGKSVLSHKNMREYVYQLSELAAQGGSAFTCALEGAKIPGIPYKKLEELLPSFPIKKMKTLLPGKAPEKTKKKENQESLKASLQKLQTELGIYIDDAQHFIELAEELRTKFEESSAELELQLQNLKPELEKLQRHTKIIEMLETLQPAVSVEIQRLIRKTQGITDPLKRAQTRLLTLAGPCVGGMELAKLIHSSLQETIQKLTS